MKKDGTTKLYTVEKMSDGWYVFFLGGGTMGPYETEAAACGAADKYIIKRLTHIFERKDD